MHSTISSKSTHDTSRCLSNPSSPYALQQNKARMLREWIRVKIVHSITETMPSLHHTFDGPTKGFASWTQKHFLGGLDGLVSLHKHNWKTSGRRSYHSGSAKITDLSGMCHNSATIVSPVARRTVRGEPFCHNCILTV